MAERIVIFADVHQGLCGPQPDGGVYGDPTPLFVRSVERAVEIAPQKVILLGDMVNRGLSEQYERVKQILEPIRAKLEPVIGNHELQRARVQDFENAWNCRATRLTQVFEQPTLILNSGIEGLPDERWNGQLDEASTQLIRKSVDQASGQPLIIFCHYPIAGTVRRSEQPMFGLDDSTVVADVLSHHPGPLVFFSAHTHMQSVVGRDLATYVGCPPLGFWPHSFLVLELADDGQSMTFSTVQVLDDPNQSPDAHAGDPQYRELAEGTPADCEGVIRLV